MQTVTKSRADAPAGFFEAEAAGLAWLAAAGGVRVVPVVRVEPGRIEVERIASAPPSAEAARRFGRALAVMHAAGAPSFGAPPEGFDGPIFIGSRPLPIAHDDTWGAFYVRDRVVPYLEIALQVGNVGARQEPVIREALDLVASGAFDDGAPPSRIHGDLWTGNVLWSPDGAVLIDPAAHGGHAETDLAMLALFGCPFLDQVFDGYDSARPLREGWATRIPLHQLHPLAVHAAGHGPSYGRALMEAARAVLAL